MEALKIDRTKLITPSEYAKLHGITPAAVTKMMNTGRVKVVEIKGGRLIYLG
jgi:predicted site-specific integrase-resolvase